jgi:hypothetical protein
MVRNWAGGKRQVEVFTAGCPSCDETVSLVRELARHDCEVTIHDVRTSGIEKAIAYGIKELPAVVVDGRLAPCCQMNGPCSGDVATLRAACAGQPQG